MPCLDRVLSQIPGLATPGACLTSKPRSRVGVTVQLEPMRRASAFDLAFGCVTSAQRRVPAVSRRGGGRGGALSVEILAGDTG